MKKYIVKAEYIDRFYGSCESEYVEQCQADGVPQEDIEFLISEWGEDVVMNMLEAI